MSLLVAPRVALRSHCQSRFAQRQLRTLQWHPRNGSERVCSALDGQSRTGSGPSLAVWGHGRGASYKFRTSLQGETVNSTGDHLLWEREAHALLLLLVSSGSLSMQEFCGTLQVMSESCCSSWGYYDKWAAAMASMLLRHGVMSESELDLALGTGKNACATEHPHFHTGDAVRVKDTRFASRWRRPHLQVPGRILGATGIVEKCMGVFEDADFHAFRGEVGRRQALYRVSFVQSELWPAYPGSEADKVSANVYESWLEFAPSGNAIASVDSTTPISPEMKPATEGGAPKRRLLRQAAKTLVQNLHDHGHQHVSRIEAEQRAVELEGSEQPGQRVLEALLDVLCSKGAISPEGLRRAIEVLDSVNIRAQGPRLVARAWRDPGFKNHLLADIGIAAASIGLEVVRSTSQTALVAVESTDEVHHLVVCTLCSCYPVNILGLPPPWYKSQEYRARAVTEPRRLLRDSFGLKVPEHVEIRVHDASAAVRYIVLPQRPDGTESWSEEELATLVTRDTMIGVAVPQLLHHSVSI